MNLERDKINKRLYDEETEDDDDEETEEDDDDSRSIISNDSNSSKNTITTVNTDTYLEDFDNKSEKDNTHDNLEDITDDILFNMNDNPDVIDNSKEDEETVEPKSFTNPEIQEISDNSSLSIQYKLDNNNQLSIPYGIYKECHTEDCKSFCLEKELTNNTNIENEVNKTNEEKDDNDDDDDEIKEDIWEEKDEEQENDEEEKKEEEKDEEEKKDEENDDE